MVSLFNIILDNDKEAEHNILETPDESNAEALDTFKSIQKQLDELLKRENALNEERIQYIFISFSFSVSTGAQLTSISIFFKKGVY